MCSIVVYVVYVAYVVLQPIFPFRYLVRYPFYDVSDALTVVKWLSK